MIEEVTKEQFADYVSEFLLALIKKKDLTKVEFCRRTGVDTANLFYWTVKKRHLPSAYHIFVIDNEFKVNMMGEILRIHKSKQQ